MITTLSTDSFCQKNVTRAKLTLSGQNVRLVECIPSQTRVGGFKKKKEQDYAKNNAGRYYASLTRSRSRIREHILNNFPPKSLFITLTYKENIKAISHDRSLRNFDIFIRKLKKKYPNIKYLAVSELQKRGAIHFHVIVDRKTIHKAFVRQSWSHGFVFFTSTYGRPSKVASYVSKYVTKSPFVDKGRKTYYTSCNLVKSVINNDIFSLYKVLDFILSTSQYEKYNHFVIESDFGKFRIIDWHVPDLVAQ